MRLYTVHAERPGSVPVAGRARPPVLLREGFAICPVLFGFAWFLGKRLWWEAAAMLALTAAILLLLPAPADGVALLALHLFAGFEARDRLRARLARQGLVEQGVIAAPDLDLAWFRLGQQRPDLVRAMP
jgi:hypothetical protein